MKKTWLLCLLCLMASICPTAMAETEITLTFGGDCVLGTREAWRGDPEAFDSFMIEKGYSWCFEKIAEPFLTDDMSLVNLECVLQDTSKGEDKSKQYRFRGDPAYTEILTLAGIEHVNIANNHYIDYKAAGKASTLKALEAGAIEYSGFENLYVFEKDGYKIGFGGCRETVYKQKKAVVKNDIEKLKEMGCDVIIYSCHWGKEYSPTHNNTQKKMAEYAIQCGANIIIGTHPHCVQGIEKKEGALIIYSLGNLVFGGTHEMTTFDALMVQAVLRFGDDGYEGVTLKLLPVLTSSDIPNNNFQPEFAQGEDHARIMAAIQKDSKIKLQTEMWFPVKGK